jgi:DNA-binding transcriptional LysR family regulator
MELRQLRTFQTVARLMNFNRAADALNYAQSTVSAQIKLLEEELGVSLSIDWANVSLLPKPGKN